MQKEPEPCAFCASDYRRQCAGGSGVGAVLAFLSLSRILFSGKNAFDIGEAQ